MSRQVIGIDIDDVLADNAAGFVAFSNEMRGTNLTPEDYDEHWALLWRVDRKEVEQRAQLFHDSRIVRDYQNNDEAVPVLRKLAKKFELRIVTSRRLQLRQDTTEWIHNHYPGILPMIRSTLPVFGIISMILQSIKQRLACVSIWGLIF